jgi:hypothetical protein
MEQGKREMKTIRKAAPPAQTVDPEYGCALAQKVRPSIPDVAELAGTSRGIVSRIEHKNHSAAMLSGQTHDAPLFVRQSERRRRAAGLQR